MNPPSRADRARSPSPTTLADIGPGLEEAVIQTAIKEGRAAAARTRPAHPANYAGLKATAEATAVLREQLGLYGWTFYKKDGINGALHPNGETMLMFVPGDRATGDRERKPKSKRRGPRGIALVISNQLSLFPDFAPPAAEPPITTWYVLTHYDRQTGQITVEVSLPRAYDKDNRVNEWESRIQVAPVATGPAVPAGMEFDADDQAQRIDVSVEPLEDAFDDDDPSRSS